jgi:hypothetical protein
MRVFRISIIIFFTAFASCNTTRHWKKVAVDHDITPEKKSLIAPHCYFLFPPSTVYLPGVPVVTVDSFYTVDTLYYNTRRHVPLDSIYPRPCVEKTKVITIKQVDTFPVIDNVLVHQLQQQLAAANSLNTGLNTTNAVLKHDNDRLTADRLYWLWWFIGACVLLLLFIYLLFKR